MGEKNENHEKRSKISLKINDRKCHRYFKWQYQYYLGKMYNALYRVVYFMRINKDEKMKRSNSLQKCIFLGDFLRYEEYKNS